jgi:DNA-binding HxlR family transcriptional regulator
VTPVPPPREASHTPARSPRWLAPAELERIEERFRAFAKESAHFREEIVGHTGLGGTGGPAESARTNLEIARTVFSKWSLETMVVLYAEREIGFSELRRRLEGISARVLSQRLKALEELGFIERKVVGSRPPRVIYVLTHEGHTVSRLGEPLFLYLRLRRTYRRRPPEALASVAPLARAGAGPWMEPADRVP